MVGPDGLEVDRHGIAGARATEVERRLERLEYWAGLAVTGEAALEIIDQSRAAVQAAQ